MPHPDLRVRPTFLTALLVLALTACGTSVDPNHPVDAGGDVPIHHPGDASASCPADPFSAIGTACSTEGQVCGDCTNPCSFCNLIRCTSGHWMAEEVFPACDAGVPPDAVPPPSGLLISWQAPGGFAGTGPAMIVQGDGSVRVWNEASGFDPNAPTTAPDGTYHVDAAAIADLVARWNATNRSGLPHGGPGAECYASLSVRPCATCAEARLSYSSSTQVLPELQTFFAWFTTNLPIATDPATNPANYCGP